MHTQNTHRHVHTQCNVCLLPYNFICKRKVVVDVRFHSGAHSHVHSMLYIPMCRMKTLCPNSPSSSFFCCHILSPSPVTRTITYNNISKLMMNKTLCCRENNTRMQTSNRYTLQSTRFSLGNVECDEFIIFTVLMKINAVFFINWSLMRERIYFCFCFKYVKMRKCYFSFQIIKPRKKNFPFSKWFDPICTVINFFHDLHTYTE